MKYAIVVNMCYVAISGSKREHARFDTAWDGHKRRYELIQVSELHKLKLTTENDPTDVDFELQNWDEQS